MFVRPVKVWNEQCNVKLLLDAVRIRTCLAPPDPKRAWDDPKIWHLSRGKSDVQNIESLDCPLK